MKELSKEQLIELLKEKESHIKELESNRVSRVQQVKALIDKGYNTIDMIADELKINNRNVSSQLTALRKHLLEEGKTVISASIDDRTYLKVVEVNWITQP